MVSMGFFGAVFGAGLAYASKKFAIVTDPRVERVLGALPGANCGGCGYAGCAAYANAVASGAAAPNRCTPGGIETAQKIAGILGLGAVTFERSVAFIRCQGAAKALRDAAYAGPQTCSLAVLVGEGPLACKNACVLMGECQAACAYGAITWQPGTVPVIREDLCTACGKCIAACPRALITLRGEQKRVLVLCRSQDKGPLAKKNCPVACIACTKCVQTCPVQAISMDGNVAVIDTQACVLCGKCVPVCPTGAIGDQRPERN